MKHNRTLKYSQSHHTGIETLDAPQGPLHRHTLNRTTLELKLHSYSILLFVLTSLNRTTLELKLTDMIAASSTGAALNRTTLELKQS